MSRIVRIFLATLMLAATLILGSTVVASAIPVNEFPEAPAATEDEAVTCQSGPQGAQESDYLPMTRWSGATTEFHSRLSWNDIVDKVQREAVMENGMAVGNFLYSLSEYMVSGALSFCLLDKVGGELDAAAAGIGQTLIDSPILTLLVVVAIIGAAVAAAKGQGSRALRSLFSKALIVGLMVAMVAGATASETTPNGGYKPGILSPGWFAVTIDTAVTTVANAPVSAMYNQAASVTGANNNPEVGDNIFDCSVHMAAMRAKYQKNFGNTGAESANALVPMVMSGIWEDSGLATWRIAQYGSDNTLSERTYCHHLDMTARPTQEYVYGVLDEINPGYGAWARTEVNGSTLVDGQAFNPQGDTARDVAIVAWAACRPSGGSFSGQVANLNKHQYKDNLEDIDGRWTTDGTLMIRGGLDDSTLSGDLANAVKGGASAAGEQAVNALDAVTFGAASKLGNLAKGTYGAIKGILGGGGDDDGEDYDPELAADEQAAACNNLFNWTTERVDESDSGFGTGFPGFLERVKAERYGPKDFNWGNESAPIQAFATYSGKSENSSKTDEARDFLLTLHGNKNMGGVVGVLIYVLSAFGMVAVFGLLAGAVLLAKVMAGVFIIAAFFVLAFALATGRDMESVAKFAKAYLGLSLFAWGAIALLAVIGLLASILATLGEAFGGWLAILWAGMSPLLAAIVLHKVFKDILHLPSPFKLTAGLAYANTMSKGGANAAMGGLDTMANKGVGMAKRTASNYLGTRAAMGRSGSKPNPATGVHGLVRPSGAGPAAAGAAGGGGAGGGRVSASAPEKVSATPGRREALAARSELQRRASDKGLPAAERKQAAKELRQMDRSHRSQALDRVREARSDGDRLRSGAKTAAKTAAIAAVPAVGPAAAGAYLGYKGVTAAGRVARDKVAERTGFGHSAMMDRAQADLDAWYSANEATAQKVAEKAAEAKRKAQQRAKDQGNSSLGSD